MPTLELEKSITFKNILVATDFSEASTNALHCAAQITEVNVAQLFIVCLLNPFWAYPLIPCRRAPTANFLKRS